MTALATATVTVAPVSVLESERADFRVEKADSRPERTGFRPERVNFSPPVTLTNNAFINRGHANLELVVSFDPSFFWFSNPSHPSATEGERKWQGQR